ncbi:MAG: hypothetical protein N2Z76_01260 [Treponemataceae bacterium]|nr:hypothetical protein [Treponemataceae bacterium]
MGFFRCVWIYIVVFLCIVGWGAPFLFAQTTPSVVRQEGSPSGMQVRKAPFPFFYYSEALRQQEQEDRARPYWVPTEKEYLDNVRAVRDYQSILLNEDILAFYGHPGSRQMGILGVYPIEELYTKLAQLGQEYEAASGGRKVRLAFYIIYGTVWPKGEIGIISENLLKKYIDFAQEKNMLVFLDHQIGRYDVIDSLKKMLPYLRYPHVHLALDPEWRTTLPMQEIGSVTAEEINRAQEIMEQYILEHDIPGERMLVIHQFNWKMIQNRDQVRADFGRVRLVHCADGFGPPAMKRATYQYNALAINMPVKAFKLFFKSGVPGAGFDDPLLSPKEVYSLNPRPYLIMYQ